MRHKFSQTVFTLATLLTGASLFALSVSVQAENYSGHPKTKAFIESLVNEHKFDRDYVESMLAKAQRKQKIIDAISRPAEKSKPWHEYRKIFLGQKRVDQGLAFWRENKDALEKASQKFGVEKEIIVAIIGVETRYGRYMGNYRVIDALATLGFDYPKRGKFFAKELKEFFLLAREQKQDLLSLKGSYAGAMGFGQFIPSSYRAYAIDFDGDGVADIWQNKVDAIGSVANYFKVHGWKTAQPVMAKAEIFVGADETQLDKKAKPNRTLGDWKKLGFGVNGFDSDRKAMLSSFVEADRTEAWFGFENFYVITRYNRSHMYARAVWELSQAIKSAYSKS